MIDHPVSLYGADKMPEEFKWLCETKKLKPSEQKKLDEAFIRMLECEGERGESRYPFIKSFLEKKIVNILTLSVDGKNVLDHFLKTKKVLFLSRKEEDIQKRLSEKNYQVYLLLSFYYYKEKQEFAKLKMLELSSEKETGNSQGLTKNNSEEPRKIASSSLDLFQKVNGIINQVKKRED